ncbi:MAG TPA: hypothetical protein VGC74_12035 [Stenotrophomonas sp.]|jgi:hypothetical protein
MRLYPRSPVLLLILSLAGCAGHRAAEVPTPVASKVVTLTPQARDGRGFLRFHMTQSGRQMTADQFDAWMKANGVRVATGKPKAPGS